MNYIDLLTQEEKEILCGIITGKEFKGLFKKNEQEFLKIRKGFRAKTLTEEMALSIAIANVDKPFISRFINFVVGLWLENIQESIEKLEEEGMDQDTALVMSLMDSFFSENIDLYFKLVGTTMDEKTLSSLLERMESIQSERMREAEVADRVEALENEKQQLLIEIEVAQQSAEALRSEYEQRVQKVEQEKENLEILLGEAQKKISDLQTTLSDVENTEDDYLTQFDDTDTSLLPAFDSDEIVSLCGVISDYSGQKWLIRYADLSHNGHYHIFRKNDFDPPFFTNRDKLYYKDGPSEDGFCGVWSWSAVPNEKDSTKDYVLSHYNAGINPVEIAVVKETPTIDDLVKQLKNGIEYHPHSRRILFAFYESKGRYKGILINSKDLHIANGKTSLSEVCTEVPVYEFSSGDIVRLENGISFYRNTFVGLPVAMYQLKSHFEIVKNIVLSSISWATYKTRGLTRAEYKSFKDFLGTIPADDILLKIKNACHCTDSFAERLLDDFLSVVWKYVDGDSLEDEIILSAITASTELQEKTKNYLRADWESENKALLEEAQSKLNSLIQEVESAEDRLTEARVSFENTKAEEEYLSSLIAEKETLAKDVERSVAERIQKARENVAEFIASMAFVGREPIQTAVKEPLAAGKFFPESDVTPYYTTPAFKSIDELEAHHSWKDVMDTAIFEFREAGVAEKYRNGLAAFLCAAYIEKQPILIVGPNANDIAQAFSASLTGFKHGTLCCEGSNYNQTIKEIGANGEDIVIINNLIASEWMNRLPEILSKKQVFFIATHPYAEDVQVEPKSLYGFMLPLFTEFIVDDRATGKYGGGYFADDFKPYSAPKSARKELVVLPELSLSPLIKNSISSLVATMKGVCSALTTDEVFLFSVLPIAYGTQSINQLIEAVADPHEGITISASLKRDLQYILGDI